MWSDRDSWSICAHCTVPHHIHNMFILPTATSLCLLSVHRRDTLFCSFCCVHGATVDRSYIQCHKMFSYQCSAHMFACFHTRFKWYHHKTHNTKDPFTLDNPWLGQQKNFLTVCPLDNHGHLFVPLRFLLDIVLKL